MASAELRDELDCSICLSLYTDPVSLRCGHFFCRSCIVSALDAQEAAGVYSCPDCRAQYPEHPALEKTRKLENVVERFSSTQPEMEETRTFCTYCDSLTPAVRTCLQCEASFCEKHLSRHSKSSEHTLVDPNVTLEGRKCSTHKEVLKYYCPIDNACICVSCWVAGDHKGHDSSLLDVAFEKEKVKLENIMEKLSCEQKDIEKRIHNLQDHRKDEKMRSTEITKRVRSLFKDLRDQLSVLERRVLCEISRQENQVLLPIINLTQELEKQRYELVRKIYQAEELCKVHDPPTFLTELNSSDGISHWTPDVIGDGRNIGTQDYVSVSQILHRGLAHFADDMFIRIKRQFSVMEKSDILLDIDTAHNNIIISQDLRSASYSDTSQDRPDGPERFKSRQVFSSRSFSSGRHYWEVDVSQAERWLIGVAGQSLERKVVGNESFIGYNDKSWALCANYFFTALHNNTQNQLVSDPPVRVVGVYLDYEAGRLSFIQVCDPIRHLHTFTASFSEPLHLAFYLFPDSCLRILN
ncbi:E3 ubiquitin-protein ligase TRIM39-like [Anomaloglossus baeobatrachus]|uniref:E3 ubiquitin-protein ligase TRIM39-like n=1 Tax=Anomaloglossus baeobatrachus TaxID=238106 RepID=UPI003F508ECE